MSVPGSASPLFLATAAAAAPAGPHQIDRSLRFNSADSAYLNRTPSSAGNRRTFTWSGWVKRSELTTADANNYLFSVPDSSGHCSFYFSADKLRQNPYTAANGSFTTDAVFRDPSAWYHVVYAYDSTQSTATDRIKLYVNGVQQTFSAYSAPTQNQDSPFSSASAHYIGKHASSSTYSNFYLAEVHFVDGTALAATDFGEEDSNGVWQPKEFTGSYGATVAAAYTGTVPTSTSDVAPAGTYGNGIATAAVLFGGTLLTNGQNHIRQDGGGIEWSAAITLSSGDVAGAQCLYFNNTSTHNIEFKINGSWVTAQTAANAVIGTTQGQGALITYTATGVGTSSWTGVRATGGSNISVTTVAGIFVNGNLVGENDIVGVNGFYLKFADNSSNAALGTDSSGNSNTWTVNNLTAAARNYTSEGSTSGSFYTSAGGAASKMFDGSASTGAFSQTGTATFTFGGSTITASTSLQVRAFKGDSSGANVLVNGTNISSLLNAQSSGGYSTVNITSTLGGAPINLSNVSLVNAGGGSGNIAQIFVDGVELVDGSASDMDSLIDTPTNYTAASGNNAGNYATLDPLSTTSNTTLSNGNLDISCGTGATARLAFSTIGMSSGKYYCEFVFTSGGASTQGLAGSLTQANYVGGGAYQWGYYHLNGKIYNNNAASNYGDSYSTGDIIGIAFDADNGNLYFYKNGTVQNSGTPAATGLTSGPYFFAFGETGFNGSVNFGQRPFAYTPPTGYVSLCTENLSESAYASIPDGSTAFDTKLWTGNDATSRAITGLNFSPDFLWIKSRSAAGWHALADSVRGAGKILASNETNSEYNNSDSQNAIQSFDTNGFTIGHQSGWVVNSNNTTIVGWAWDAGTSTVSNTDGSITSSVRANASAGFSIVSYAGNSTNNSTIGHGLNAAPELIITKNRSAAYNWITYSAELAATKVLALDGTFAAFTPSGGYYSNVGASTYQVVQGSANLTNLNNSGNDYIAYCFAPVEGYSAFGSYTGNGNSDGPFVYTGFRPKFVMRKRTDSAVGWYIIDTARDTFNEADSFLDASDNDAEGTSTNVDILSNGFKLRNPDAGTNASGGTYIYAAFAEHPFRTARAR